MDISHDSMIVGAIVIIALTTVLIAFFRSSSKKPFLNRERQNLTLVQKENISHDTIRLQFALPKGKHLGLPVGKHIKLFAPNHTKSALSGQWNGREDPEKDKEQIERKYTPISQDSDEQMELVIKVYKGGVIERFPDGGKMSQHLDGLKVGQQVSLSGPWGAHEYLGKGVLKSGSRSVTVSHFGMMAGGSGVTPMIQVLMAILNDPEDKTEVSLLFANQTEDDILLRDMLEGLQKAHPSQFHLWYTVDRPPQKWGYSSGFITAEMIQEHLPAPGPDTAILMCGPPPMIEFACKKNLDTLGYHKQSMFAW